MRNHWPAFLFFTLFIWIGFSVVPDYGMSWDEAVQREYGLVAVDYAMEKLQLPWSKFEPDKDLNTNPGREYTVLFSMIAASFERLLNLEEDFRRRFLLRHSLVFGLFCVGVLFFYLLLYQYFQEVTWALLGVCFLVLSPRIFAHAHYNPKDIVLLSTYLIAGYTMVRFIGQQDIKWAIWHGLATAIAINSRFPALIIPALTGLLWFLDRLQNLGRNQKWGRKLIPLTVYLFATVALSFLFFPYLWEAPSARASRSFQLMAQFPWGSHNLFFGQYVKGEAIPWYYIPVWIGITTPILYLLGILTGCYFLIKQLLPNLRRLRLWSTLKEQVLVIQLGLFLGPLTAVILLQSTLYNGWRQLYFIYPPLLFIAVWGLQQLWVTLKSGGKKLMALIVSISLLATLWNMVREHPNQQVYYNWLAGDRLTERFDMDYWGVAYYQAWKGLADQQVKKKVKVKCANYPCEDNYRFLPEIYKSKVELVWDIKQADYYLSNFRRPNEHQKYLNAQFPMNQPGFFIYSNSHPIIGVFRLNQDL